MAVSHAFPTCTDPFELGEMKSGVIILRYSKSRS